MQLNKVAHSDALTYLRSLPDNSIHCVATSGPYWGLRQYSGDQIKVWGGDPECICQWEDSDSSPTKLNRITERELELDQIDPKNRGPWKEAPIAGTKNIQQGSTETEKWASLVHGMPNASGGKSDKQLTNSGSFAVDYNDRKTMSAVCILCGAWRGALGLEPSPQMFVEHLMIIFKEVLRVLHPSGVAWLNIGDTYIGSGGAGGDYNDGGLKEGQPRWKQGQEATIPPKNLALVPERLKIALQEAGFFIRDTVIWVKGSPPKDGYEGSVGAPMPTSVNSRCTPAYEIIIQATKNANYFFDMEAEKEPLSAKTLTHRGGGGVGKESSQDALGKVASGNLAKSGYVRRPDPSGTRQPRNVWFINTMPSQWEYCSHCDTYLEGTERNQIKKVPDPKGSGTKQAQVVDPTTGKEKAQYDGFNERYTGKEKIKMLRLCPTCKKHDGWVGHFAAWPAKLARKLIRLGSSPYGVCSVCLAPWERVVEKGEPDREWQKSAGGKDGIYTGTAKNNPDEAGVQNPSDVKRRILAGMVKKKTVGFDPTCDHFEKKLTPSESYDLALDAGDSFDKEWDEYAGKQRWFDVKDGEIVEVTDEVRKRDQKEMPDKERRMGKLGLGAGHGDVYPTRSVYSAPKTTVGWTASCDHPDAKVIPSRVLDPFMGSGTTALVARKEGRVYLGCDLSETYVKIINHRLKRGSPRMKGVPW